MSQIEMVEYMADYVFTRIIVTIAKLDSYIFEQQEKKKSRR